MLFVLLLLTRSLVGEGKSRVDYSNQIPIDGNVYMVKKNRVLPRLTTRENVYIIGFLE